MVCYSRRRSNKDVNSNMPTQWIKRMWPKQWKGSVYVPIPKKEMPEYAKKIGQSYAECHSAQIGCVHGKRNGNRTGRFHERKRSPCHLVPSRRIRPLATAVVAPLHPALSLASRLMLLIVAPLAYPLRVSTHLCLGLPLFLAPFILPSITSSSIPPALTTCPK